MSDAVEAPGFEYVPTTGVHSAWVVWVNEESTERSYSRLSKVEEEIESWIDEELEERDVTIVRVTGAHEWRTFELSDGSVIKSDRLRDRLGDLLAKPVDTRPKVTFDAPVGSVDLRVFDDDGNPFPVHSCHDCLPWHAEVVQEPETGEILVREWHAWECETLQRLLTDQ